MLLFLFCSFTDAFHMYICTCTHDVNLFPLTTKPVKKGSTLRGTKLVPQNKFFS